MSEAIPKVNSTAAGQLLGYTLQLPRALCRLLEVGAGGAVGVEVLGDVSSYLPNGDSINEEDKSSISGNPLTDRSTDLWKTFHNWIKLIETEAIDPDKTQFVLYCNQQGQKSLVNLFDEASTGESAKAARQAAEEEMKGLSADHAISSYYDYVVNANTDIFEEVITRFELIIGGDSAHADVRAELTKLMVEAPNLDLISQAMGGWFQETVLQMIYNKQPAIVRHDTLRHHFTVLVSSIRQRELVDFAAEELSVEDHIDDSIRRRPVFVRQLDLIELPEDRKLEAVADYLKADHNRNRWIENETLDERTADDFEGRLRTFWSTEKRKTERLCDHLSEGKRGEALLDECISRQELIRGIPPPDRTIAGTYHALANRKDVGWHPKWDALLEGEDAN